MRIPDSFIQAARVGRNELWRYLVTVAGSSLLLMLASALVTVGAFALVHTLPIPADWTPAVSLAVALAPFAGLILGLDLGLRRLHGRGLHSLIRPGGRFRWGLLAASGGVWLAISALGDGLMSLVYPGSYALTFDPALFWPVAMVAVLLLPIQVAAEELWFRGYLTQGVGLAGGAALGWIGPALLFGLLHGFNPEVGAYGLLLTLPVYISMGLLLGWVTLRSAGLEMSLGLHLANNLYATLLVTAPASALPAPALFTVDQAHPEVALAVNLAGVVVYVMVVTIVLRGKRRE